MATSAVPPPPGLTLPPPGLDHPSVRNSTAAKPPPPPPSLPPQHNPFLQHSHAPSQQQGAHFVSLDVNRPMYQTEEELDVFAREKLEKESGGGGLFSRVMSRFSMRQKGSGSETRKEGSSSSSGRLGSFTRLGSFRLLGGSKMVEKELPRASSFHSNTQQRGPAAVRMHSDLESDYDETATVFSNYSGNTLKSSNSKHVNVVAQVHTKAGKHEIVRSKQRSKKKPSTSNGASRKALFEDDRSGEPNPMFQQHVTPPRPFPVQTQLVPSAYSPDPLASPRQPDFRRFGSSSDYQQMRPPPSPMTPGRSPQTGGFGSSSNRPPPLPTLPPARQQQQAYAPMHPQAMSPHIAAHSAAVRVVQVTHDFDPDALALQQGVFTLRRGEVIQVIEQTPDGWWQGLKMPSGQRGYFAPSFVRVMQ